MVKPPFNMEGCVSSILTREKELNDCRSLVSMLEGHGGNKKEILFNESQL